MTGEQLEEPHRVGRTQEGMIAAERKRGLVGRRSRRVPRKQSHSLVSSQQHEGSGEPSAKNSAGNQVGAKQLRPLISHAQPAHSNYHVGAPHTDECSQHHASSSFKPPSSLPAHPSHSSPLERLQLSIALDHLEVAAACLSLPPSLQPPWLGALLSAKTVGMVIGALWRAKRVEVPALSMCHMLISLGVVSNAARRQLVDLVKVWLATTPPSCIFLSM